VEAQNVETSETNHQILLQIKDDVEFIKSELMKKSSRPAANKHLKQLPRTPDPIKK